MDLKELQAHLKNLPHLADKDRDKRVAKALKNFKYFVKTYFPHHIEYTKREYSEFRNFVYSDIDNLIDEYRLLLFLVYRGGAKTTLFARLLTLWAIAKRDKRFIVIISNSLDVAQNSIELIKTEIEENQNFRVDFEIKEGDTWQSAEIVISSKDTLIKVKAFGAGKRIRGENFLGARPDLIILDDIENDENVESKTQRDKLYKQFTKAILKLPSRQNSKFNIIIIGTLLHYDAVLKRIKDRRDVKSFEFALVNSFPSNMEAWEELYKLERKQALREYNSNKKIYNEGYLLDDERLDKFSIMMEYFEDKESFLSEYQHIALSSENALFSEYSTFETIPNDLVYYMGIDPALGKAKGDYSAISIIGKSNQTKNFYTIYSKGFKIHPNRLIEKIIELYLSFKPLKVVVETVAFQEFFKDILKENSTKHNIFLPIVEKKNRVNKELRIDSLSPYIESGTLLINPNEHLLIEELLTYPKSAHDDLLDSLEMAFGEANNSFADLKKFQKAIKREFKIFKKGI